MDKQELDPVATILADSYLATWAFSRSFRDEYDRPPTVATRVHYMRSVAQVGFEREDRFDLSNDYLEFGRIQVDDLQADRTFLLRSESAVAIEFSMKQNALFDATQYLKTDVIMLVYRFSEEGIHLLVAATRRRPKSKHLEAWSAPIYVGTWPYAPLDDASTFDQGTYDPFGDLGELDIEDDGETDTQ